MNKYLIIGDVHAQASDLKDCKGLVRLIADVIKEHDGKLTVVFMGDQYNDHAIINAEVLNFWHQTFKFLAKRAHRIIALVGNHDQPGSSTSGAHSMLAHSEQVLVVDKYFVDAKDSVAFVPYVHDKEEFVTLCNSLDAKILMAHQSFTGAQFENGFYDPSGVDQELVPNKQIICGHVHMSQTLGRVTYVGSPRWRTRSDANEEKAIWLYEIEKGEILSKTPYGTSGVCRKILSFEDREGSEAPVFVTDPKDRVYIDVYGSDKYIQDAKSKYANSGAILRTFRNKETRAIVKESDGVFNAFDSWMKVFQPKNGTDYEMLSKMLKERLQG